MFRTLFFLSASLVVHGTVGVCLWTSAHWSSVQMGLQKGDNSANIVIVSPGELNLGKSLKKEHEKAKSSEEKDDVSDFIRPLPIEIKNVILIPPKAGGLKSSVEKPGKEAVSSSAWTDAKETVGKDQMKQNAVCVVIPSRQIGVETISETSNVNPAPRYPKIAILKGWEGETVVKVSVNPQGKVEHIEVIQPSGHDVLDNAVLETLQLWRFEKGTARELEIPIRFILKNAV